MTTEKVSPRVTAHPAVMTSKPRSHTSSSSRSVNLTIQCQFMPHILETWERPLQVAWHQPSCRSNLTHLLVFAGTKKPPSIKWHRVHTWRFQKSDGKLILTLRSKHTRSMKHPFPIGTWSGRMETSPTRWCLFHFQAQTLVMKSEEPKVPERRRIILPHEARGLPRVVAPPGTKIVLP